MDGLPQPLEIADFAKRIKEKYPDYANLDDVDLVERVVRKHPTYASQVKLPEGFKLLQTSSGHSNLDEVYEQKGREYNVDPNLLLAQGRQETINFNPDVMYGRRGSPKNAQGSGQFISGTAKRFGVNVKNPISGIDGQARYMRELLDQFDNDEELALAGYNAGEHRKSLRQGKIPEIPETQEYVKRIRGELAKTRKVGDLRRLLGQSTPQSQTATAPVQGLQQVGVPTSTAEPAPPAQPMPYEEQEAAQTIGAIATLGGTTDTPAGRVLANSTIEAAGNAIDIQRQIETLGKIGEAAAKGQKADIAVDEAYQQFLADRKLPDDKTSVDAFNKFQKDESLKKFQAQPGYADYKKFITDVGGYEEGSPESIQAYNEAQQALGSIRDEKGQPVPSQEAAEKYLTQPAKVTAGPQQKGQQVAQQAPAEAAPEAQQETVRGPQGAAGPAAKFSPVTSMQGTGNAREEMFGEVADQMVAKLGIDRQTALDALHDDKLWEGGQTTEAEAQYYREHKMTPSFTFRNDTIEKLQQASKIRGRTEEILKAGKSPDEQVAEKELDVLARTPKWAGQTVVANAISQGFNPLDPVSRDVAAHALGDWLFGNGELPLSDDYVEKIKQEAKSQAGSARKVIEGEAAYQAMGWPETFARMASQTARSFAKNLLSGTAKSASVIGQINEDMGWGPNITKVIGNGFEFITRLISGASPEEAMKYMQGRGTPLSDTHWFKVAQAFDTAVGDDPKLKGRFLGALSDAGGSALAFVALGAVLPELQLGKLDLSLGVAGGIQSQGTGYEEGKLAGLSESDAKKYGAIQFLLGTTEMFGAGQELAHVIKSKSVLRNLSMGILEAAKHEGLQEFAQEVFQTAGGKAALEYFQNQDPSVLRRVTTMLNGLPSKFASAVTNEGAIALITGAGMGGLGGGVQRLVSAPAKAEEVAPVGEAPKETAPIEASTVLEAPAKETPQNDRVNVPFRGKRVEGTVIDRADGKLTVQLDSGGTIRVNEKRAEPIEAKAPQPELSPVEQEAQRKTEVRDAYVEAMKLPLIDKTNVREARVLGKATVQVENSQGRTVAMSAEKLHGQLEKRGETIKALLNCLHG